MIYLHFTLSIIRNIKLFIASESIISLATQSALTNFVQLLVIGGEKKIKGLYNSRKSVQQPFIENKLNSYLMTQFTTCHLFRCKQKQKNELIKYQKIKIWNEKIFKIKIGDRLNNEWNVGRRSGQQCLSSCVVSVSEVSIDSWVNLGHSWSKLATFTQSSTRS